MMPKRSKNIVYVAVLSVLLVAVQCEDVAKPKPNFTKSSDPENPLGLEGIKSLPSMEKESSSHLQLNEKSREPNEKEEEGEKRIQQSKKSESLTSAHNDNNKSDDVSQKKEANNIMSSSHSEAEMRSNTTKSAGSAEHIPSTHPLFTDRHQGDASGAAGLVNHNSDPNAEEVVHEHVVKYQLHQSSEQDSDEDASFKAPVSGGAHKKVSDSVVVSSNSFPVRLGSNQRTPGNGNSNRNVISTVRKPIPVVRQEAAEAAHTPNDSSESHDAMHDRYIL